MDAKGSHAARVAAAEFLRRRHPRPERQAALNRSLARLDGLRSSGAHSGAHSLASVRGISFRSLQLGGARVQYSITTLPYDFFASGHTFFSQSLQARRGFEPVAVHTTFQFGDTAEFAWGKRSRLRERLLWLVDPPEYYAKRSAYSSSGQPKDPTERGSPPPPLPP